MRKIITPLLSVELTQFCNLNCKHCLKGECRNITITREIIEKALDEIKYISILHLTGGEVFLAYEQLKLFLEIAKEKNVKIEECSMIINGTVYDERIYKLLDKWFPNNYSVSISYDEYHQASIKEKFRDNINIVYQNIKRHYFHKNSDGFKNSENVLINTGRAKNLNTLKKEFEPIGYYWDYWKENYLLIGPYIFLNANGYISDGNLEIESCSKKCLGNVLEETIGAMVTHGGIHLKCASIEDFFELMNKRENDYQYYKGDHWQFKNHKLVPYKPVPNTSYEDAAQESIQLIKLLLEKGIEAEEFQRALTVSIEKTPHDVSQIVHLFQSKR